jgi:uncharacterized protein YbaR (Trm112 family)
MHIELIDLLRCTHKHPDTHLVAVFHRIENRDVIHATLGCPVCGASFPLRNGVAMFASESGKVAAGKIAARLGGPDAAVRLAAYLDLTSPGLVVVIAETWDAALPELMAMAQPRLFGLTRDFEVADPAAAAWLQVASVIPLASHSVDGIALGREFADPPMISEAHRVLRPGRRLVAPAQSVLSEGFRELARDEAHVVAERMPELIRLSR